MRRHGWKVLTHDWRPPIQGGAPLCDGVTWPVVLPRRSADPSADECGAGWNYCPAPEAALRIGGLWPTGRPSRLVVVETDGLVLERGVKCRTEGLTLVREATPAEWRVALLAFSAPFGEHAEPMAVEQARWHLALGREGRSDAAVMAGLTAALTARGLGWSLRRFASGSAARAARAARDAWDAWAARDARDARDALTTGFSRLMGWQPGDPLQYTVGLRDAYHAGLAIALPTGPTELGWAMEAVP